MISKAALLAFVVLLLPGDARSAEGKLPAGFEQMEIEAKWYVGSRAAFEKLIAAFPNGSKHDEYRAKVRWDGLPRKFVDDYYDTKSGALAGSMHVLRHRMRYKAKLDASRRTDPAALAGAPWSLEWTKLQYKSTPCRIGAIWFRREVGGCSLWDEKNEDLCPAIAAPAGAADAPDAVRPVLTSAHEAIVLLRAEHPNLTEPLESRTHVVDYRYRAELSRAGEEEAELELSLDQLETSTGAIDYQAELEILSKPDSPTVDRLQRLVRALESNRDFELRPAITNKSGAVGAEVEVRQCN